MFSKIMIPVDLSHWDKMARPIEIAMELARSHDADILLVSVESDHPSSIAHNPQEFRQKLSAAAKELASRSGLAVESQAIICSDPTSDMSQQLLHAAEESGTDLIVMATHVPGMMDHVFASHGGHVARYAKISVFLVR